MSIPAAVGYNGLMRREITFTSEFDGSEQRAVMIAPEDAGREPLPLVIVPHAAGWTGEATAGYWRDVPVRHGTIAVFPYGHSRVVPLRSMGWRGQISDLASLPHVVEDMGYPVDRSRIYAAGISMGGQEGLLLAAKHPGLLAAVASFNAVVDLRAWYYDCDPEVCGRMMIELGGTPEEVPDAYAERSPINYAATLAEMPSLIYWDPNDAIVQFQEEKQSGRLYRLIKEADPNAPIEAHRHNHGHSFVNPSLALRWLLEHRRGA